MILSCLQLKHHVRRITPEEYDTAVQRDVFCSPHAATGDRRSGSRLLAEAGADQLLSVADLVASREGRAELDTIATAMEEVLCLDNSSTRAA
jgi:hypothetical protein